MTPPVTGPRLKFIHFARCRFILDGQDNLLQEFWEKIGPISDGSRTSFGRKVSIYDICTCYRYSQVELTNGEERVTCYPRAMGPGNGTVFGWCNVKGQDSSKEVSIGNLLLLDLFDRTGGSAATTATCRGCFTTPG